jgi:hypothetical protein
MKFVRIVHPEAGEADVPESAVPTWRSSGWELASEAETDEQNSSDGTTEQDSKPSRSRRRSTEESE